MNEVITTRDLFNEWAVLNNNKNGYAFGEDFFDRTAFANLIQRTFVAIKSFKEKMDFSTIFMEPIDCEKNITPYDIIMYSKLIAEIAKYSTDILIDESEDYIFTASLIITRFLLLYANSAFKVSPTDDNGILGGLAELAQIYRPVGDEDFEFWSHSFHFDPSTGDFTEIIELAKRYNNRFEA